MPRDNRIVAGTTISALLFCSLRRRRLFEQKAYIAGEDALAVTTKRAQFANEIADRFALPNLLRIVGRKHDARSGKFAQTRFDRADTAGKSRRVEDEIVPDVMIEVFFSFAAVTPVTGRAPKFLIAGRPGPP